MHPENQKYAFFQINVTCFDKLLYNAMTFLHFKHKYKINSQLKSDQHKKLGQHDYGKNHNCYFHWYCINN